MLRATFALCAAALPAQTPSLTLRVDAAGVDRLASPAVFAFAWPAPLEAAAAAADQERPTSWAARLVATPGGRELPCEVLALSADPGAPRVGELRFVVDRLAADASLKLQLHLGAAPDPARPPYEVDDTADARRLTLAGQPLLRHETAFDRGEFEATKKPIWHLFDPASGVAITKGAGGEFPHHRGLFLGWNKTRVGDATYDLWHCPAPAQRHAGHAMPDQVLSQVRAQLVAGTDWLTPIDEIVARETRTLVFWRQPTGSTLLDVESAIGSDRALTLDGDPHHAGVHLRLAEEVSQRKDARYLYPDGARRDANDVWSDCPWVGCLASIDGHRVAVLFMSHPDNPAPVRWSTRDYGRFGAFFRADVEAGTPLRLRYRVQILSLGDDTGVDVATCARAYADYAKPVVVTAE